jgi:hypothetical protein
VTSRHAQGIAIVGTGGLGPNALGPGEA